MTIIKRVIPETEYPPCLKIGKVQNCTSCEVAKKHGSCNSVRGLCIKPYYAHKKGCPNYNRRKDCPPKVKMLDEYFIMDTPYNSTHSNVHQKKDMRNCIFFLY